MFDKNSSDSEPYQVVGRFSAIVGPILMRLLPDRRDRQWFQINRTVGRKDFYIIFHFHLFDVVLQGVVACYLLSETGLWSRTTSPDPPSNIRVSFLAMLLPLRTSEARTEADGEITGKERLSG